MKIVSSISGSLFLIVVLGSSPVLAGLTPCGVVVAQCGGKAAAHLAPNILAPKAACHEVNDCKSVFKKNKRNAEKSNRAVQEKCLSACDRKRGKGKKCRRACEQDNKSGNTVARSERRECVKECRGQWKTSQCKQARTALTLAAIAET